YDALYGTDALEPPAKAKGYDPERGAKVITFARGVLDQIAPLSAGSHRDALAYVVTDGTLAVQLRTGAEATLTEAAQFAGWRGDAEAPSTVLLRHHGLHVEIQIDRDHPIGKDDPAGVADVVLESALTVIQDCEDKVAVYRNWLGLMRGDLEAGFIKGGERRMRRLEPDRRYAAPGGCDLVLPGRSLML